MFVRVLRYTFISGKRYVHQDAPALRQKVIRIKESNSVDEVFRILMSSPAKGAPNLPTLATAMHRLAKTESDRERVTSDPLFRELLSHLGRLSHMLSVNQLAMVAQGLGRLQSVSSLWGQLQTQALHLRKELNPGHMTTILVALAQVDIIPEPSFIRMVEEESLRNIKGFTPEDVALFLSGVARLRLEFRGDESGQEVRKLETQLFQQFAKNIKEVENSESFGLLLWSFGELGYMPDKEILDLVLQECYANHCEQFSTQSLSRLFCGLAKLGIRPRSNFVRKFMDRAIEVSADFYGSSLSRMIWGLGVLRLGTLATPFIQETLSDYHTKHYFFDRKEGALLLSGLTSMGFIPEVSLLEHLMHVASNDGSSRNNNSSSIRSIYGTSKVGKNFSAEHLPDLMYGLVKSEHSPQKHPGKLRMMANMLLAEGPNLTAHHIALSMYCFGCFGWKNESFTRTFCQLAHDKRNDFEPGDIALFVNGLSKAWYHVRVDIIEVMHEEIQKKAHRFVFGHVSMLLRGFAQLNVKSEKELIVLLLNKIILDFGKPTTKMLSDLLWSLATLGLPPDPLLVDLLSDEATKIMHQFTPTEMSEFMWGFATLGIQPKPELLDIFQSFAFASLDNFEQLPAYHLRWALATIGVDQNSPLLTKLQSKAEV